MQSGIHGTRAAGEGAGSALVTTQDQNQNQNQPPASPSLQGLGKRKDFGQGCSAPVDAFDAAAAPAAPAKLSQLDFSTQLVASGDYCESAVVLLPPLSRQGPPTGLEGVGGRGTSKEVPSSSCGQVGAGWGRTS